MEVTSQLMEEESTPLTSISLNFEGTKTSSALLTAYLHKLTRARTVGDLHQKLAGALAKLSHLDAFETSSAMILPGQQLNSAVVQFDLKDSRWWDLRLGVDASNEGGRSIVSGIVRNLRGRADQTQAAVEYKHNTGTWGYELSHTDKLFRPEHYSASFSVKKATEELDQNVLEDSFGGAVSFKTLDGVHGLTLGRTIRTNLIATEFASIELLRNELPATAKNSLTHTYKLDTRDNDEQPRAGYLATVTNEVAVGNDACFHKVEGRVSEYFELLPDITLQLSGILGFFLPWTFHKTKINDRFRGRYLKGFRSVGDRFPSVDAGQYGKYLVEGDDLGKMSQLSAEAKVHFYNTPILHAAGLTPFLYSNLIIVDPLHTKSASHFQKQARGSLGFGLGWNTAFGRVEFSYATRVFSKPGDVAAELQVLFAN
jgi:outer membrane protein assembly factor BamA